MNKAKRSVDDDETEGASEAEIRTFSRWKFDILETVNADPLTNPTDVAIVEAYLHFTRPKSRTAYLSVMSLRIRTAVKSTATIVSRQKVLVKLGYLKPYAKTRTGITVYQIENARQAIVDEHVRIPQETLREADALRKQKDRERRRANSNVPSIIERTRSANVPSKNEITEGACPTKKSNGRPINY